MRPLDGTSEEHTGMGTPFVRTALGDIDPSELGYTHTHEHLLCDLTLPLPSEATIAQRRSDEEEITLENYYRVRRNHPSSDLHLHSEADAVEAMTEYRAAGGGSIVEATPIGLGRDPEGIARISRATGVAIVMGATFYCRPYHPTWLDDLDEKKIADLIVADVTEGVCETGVRSGIIGEVGLSWPHHPVEERVLRAAAITQKETGAPLLIHPGRNPESPFIALKIVEENGGDLGHTIVSHAERTIFGKDAMRRLADTGAYIEYDLFGQESSYYSMAPLDMPNDATRVDYIVDLFEYGAGERVLVAQDICHKTHMRKYGGEGYTHILENIIPLMRRKGLTAEQVETVTVANPARVLTMQA